MTITYQISDIKDASEIRETLENQGVPDNLIEGMTETIYCEFRNFQVQIDFTENGGLLGYCVKRG